MVEIQNLTKYYGSKAALKGISFTIKENEVLGFLGPNGAGKSTTLNIMAGVIPSTGRKPMHFFALTGCCAMS